MEQQQRHPREEKRGKKSPPHPRPTHRKTPAAAGPAAPPIRRLWLWARVCMMMGGLPPSVRGGPCCARCACGGPAAPLSSPRPRRPGGPEGSHRCVGKGRDVERSKALCGLIPIWSGENISAGHTRVCLRCECGIVRLGCVWLDPMMWCATHRGGEKKRRQRREERAAWWWRRDPRGPDHRACGHLCEPCDDAQQCCAGRNNRPTPQGCG